MSSPAGLKELMSYFEMGVSEFSKEWKQLTDEDKAQLKIGIGNGSFTY